MDDVISIEVESRIIASEFQIQKSSLALCALEFHNLLASESVNPRKIHLAAFATDQSTR
jgi:hypothetical protein